MEEGTGKLCLFFISVPFVMLENHKHILQYSPLSNKIFLSYCLLILISIIVQNKILFFNQSFNIGSYFFKLFFNLVLPFKIRLVQFHINHCYILVTKF